MGPDTSMREKKKGGHRRMAGSRPMGFMPPVAALVQLTRRPLTS